MTEQRPGNGTVFPVQTGNTLSQESVARSQVRMVTILAAVPGTLHGACCAAGGPGPGRGRFRAGVAPRPAPCRRDRAGSGVQSVSGRRARLWPPSCRLAPRGLQRTVRHSGEAVLPGQGRIYPRLTSHVPLMHLAPVSARYISSARRSRLQAAAVAPSGLAGSSGADCYLRCPRPPCS